MSTSTQTTHINLLPSSHRQIHRGQRHHLWRLRVGVLTRWRCWVKSNQWRSSAPSCPKASPLGSASAQVGRKVRYFSCDKSLEKYQVISRQKRLCELMFQLSSDCLEFFWLRLNSFSHSLQISKMKKWKLSCTSTGGSFSPYQSQWSPKGHLWPTGSLSPCCSEGLWHSRRQTKKHWNDTKTSQWVIWILQLKVIRKLFCQT